MEAGDKTAECVLGTPEQGTAKGCEGCPNKSVCSTTSVAQRDPALDEIKLKFQGIKNTLLVIYWVK